jgi:hypothetical protein
MMENKTYKVLLEVEAEDMLDISDRVDELIDGTKFDLLQITQKDD